MTNQIDSYTSDRGSRVPEKFFEARINRITYLGLTSLWVSVVLFIDKIAPLAPIPEPIQLLATIIFIIPIVIIMLINNVKRLHDINFSACWLLLNPIPIVGEIFAIVLFCKPGTKETNRFGPPPNPAPVRYKIMVPIFPIFLTVSIVLDYLDML